MQKAKSTIGLIFTLILILAGAGAAGHLLRPDLSPFDGRLTFTISFVNINDIKPGAPVNRNDSGATETMGRVTSVRFDTAKKLYFVSVRIEKPYRHLCLTENQFAIANGMLGMGETYLAFRKLADQGTAIRQYQVFEGTEGILGGLEKLKRKAQQKFEDAKKRVEEERRRLEAEKKRIENETVGGTQPK